MFLPVFSGFSFNLGEPGKKAKIDISRALVGLTCPIFTHALYFTCFFLLLITGYCCLHQERVRQEVQSHLARDRWP